MIFPLSFASSMLLLAKRKEGKNSRGKNEHFCCDLTLLSARRTPNISLNETQENIQIKLGTTETTNETQYKQAIKENFQIVWKLHKFITINV